jgi:hypothetical protein
MYWNNWYWYWYNPLELGYNPLAQLISVHGTGTGTGTTHWRGFPAEGGLTVDHEKLVLAMALPWLGPGPIWYWYCMALALAPVPVSVLVLVLGLALVLVYCKIHTRKYMTRA